MIDDPTHAARLTTREVRTGSRDGETTRIVVARRDYATDRPDLWDALTDPERIPRWFLPVSGDLEVGGRYQLEGNAGGVVEACAEPEAFTVTWEYGPMVSWLTVRLEPADDGTTLELRHESPVDPDMWDQFGPGAVGIGWDLALLGLGLHLQTGEAVDPSEGATFTMTDDGRAFVEIAARDWGEAAARDGDDPETAEAAAAGTIAFYTTPPEPQPDDADPEPSGPDGVEG
ncbi:SRPBCC domain-containing protein [Salsipaludibacter albus]|uniref:SRPBCC domain-containing protein n=1 Tax=Salsipaludibacter albus TaxID=2849650 RepID=UPI001EE406E7|nr:SRPBCC domain-containing protein [Salsipaludibacter albus]MBY5162279.1 SRPBCC domain-containing protein [Salsipaludibacter albus]